MVFHQEFNSLGNYSYNSVFYKNTEWQPHFHKNIELIRVLSGEVDATVNGREETLSPGDCALILSNQIHSYKCPSGAKYWIAVFSEDFVPKFAAAVKSRQGKKLAFRCGPETDALAEAELMRGDSSVMMKKACLYAVCDCFLNSVGLEERSAKNDSLIGALLDYVAEGYTGDISLASAAEHFGYEYHYLSRLLSRVYRINFRRLLNGYRVDAAAEMLRGGGRTMTEIALDSGFQSIRSFNHVFRIFTGKTPRQFADSDE